MTKPSGSPSSVFWHASLLLSGRRLILMLSTIAAVIAMVMHLAFKEHVAQARFTPESNGNTLGNLAGVASQFGFDVPGNASSQGPEFYAQLLDSEDLLVQAASHVYPIHDSAAASIFDWLELDSSSREARHEALEWFRSRLSVSADRSTGIVTVQFRAETPELAESVASQLIELVNEFNVEKRLSRAAAEREFLESRLEEARSELTSAEGELQAFLESNRSGFQATPRLAFEYGRLQRRMVAQEQLYGTIAAALEQARIEEVRTTPVITVLDRPAASANAEGSLVRKVVLAALLGVVLGAGLLYLDAFLKMARASDPEAAKSYERVKEATIPSFLRS